MKKILSLIVLLISFSLHASAPLTAWQNATVKVRSFPCLTKRPIFEGSGLLLQDGDDSFVITSEHVLIHEKSQRICHEVENEKLGTIRSELEDVSFTKGLALLKVPLTKKKMKWALSWPELEVSRQREKNGEKTYVGLGHPSHSLSLRTLKGGKEVSHESARSFVPMIPHMIEVSALPVEYGMSGGILLSSDGNGEFHFEGILSHQVLRRNGGKVTGVDVIHGEKKTDVIDFSLAIPAPDVQKWFFERLEKKDLWKRDTESQILGKEVISYGPLLFELERVPEASVFGVGGGDGAGIGGGDGAGIGGSSRSSPQLGSKFQAIVHVKFHPKASAEEKSQELEISLLNTWRLWILRGEKLKLAFFREQGEPRLKEFHSLEEMLTLWLREEQKPVALRSGLDELDVSIKKLLDLSQKTLVLIQSERESTLEVSLKGWLGLLRDAVIMAQEGSLGSADIESLFMGEHRHMWDQYYDSHFEKALVLEGSLLKLIQHLKKMGL